MELGYRHKFPQVDKEGVRMRRRRRMMKIQANIHSGN